MRKAGIFFSLVILLMLGGCATVYNPATEKKELIFIDTQSEVSLGANIDQQVRAQYKVSKDKGIEARLQKIAGAITKVSDRQDLVFRFTVLESKEVNAFATPGGYIYVFTGLIGNVTDDELAGVIAHEVGHVAARHIVKKLQAQLGYEILMSFAFGATNPTDIERAVNLTFNMISLGYSRGDELEADKLAVKYMNMAGFNPRAMIEFLEKLQKMEQSGLLSGVSIFSTHPTLKVRMAELEKLLADNTKDNELIKFCPQCGNPYTGRDKFCPYDRTELQYNRQ